VAIGGSIARAAELAMRLTHIDDEPQVRRHVHIIMAITPSVVGAAFVPRGEWLHSTGRSSERPRKRAKFTATPTSAPWSDQRTHDRCVFR
jgi:hypothetical protein